MGFFSFKCSKSNISIPAYPDAGLPVGVSTVVMVTPKNRKIEGVYDGYGRIDGHDVYGELAQDLYGKNDRDLIFGKTVFLLMDGTIFAEVQKGMFNTPITETEIVAVADSDIKNLVIGNSLNDLTEKGIEVRSLYDAAAKMIKIVRKDFYEGEDYNDLSPSKDDPDQGFFYDAKTKKAIEASLGTKKPMKSTSKMSKVKKEIISSLSSNSLSKTRPRGFKVAIGIHDKPIGEVKAWPFDKAIIGKDFSAVYDNTGVKDIIGHSLMELPTMGYALYFSTEEHKNMFLDFANLSDIDSELIKIGGVR
jgi:hypothetical protein